jgi:hypothetical protein
MFTNWILTSEEAKLSVNVNKSYLTFKLKKPAGDTATVAVELAQEENNSLVFRPHSNSDIIFFTSYGNCIGCNFLRDWDKVITGCVCARASGQTQGPSGCKYSVIKTL